MGCMMSCLQPRPPVADEPPVSSLPTAHSPETQQAGCPKGHIRPCLVVLAAAFMINFTACGLLFGFGVYQALYESMHADTGSPFAGATPAEIDLIGSLSASLLTLGAPLTVGWAQTLGPRLVVWAGGVVFGLAHVLASYGTALWHFQLAQGLLVGVGACFAFMPSMVVTPTWFGKRRRIAMGITSAGTGVGGLVWAPALSACIDHMGFRNTLRLTGALSTALICLSGSVLRWAPASIAPPPQEGGEKACTSSRMQRLWRIPLPSWATIREYKFIAQAGGALLQSAVYYTPVFFTVSYARSLGWSDATGANLTALSNACNAIGKVGVGFVADKVGRLNAFFMTTLVSAVATLAFWVSSTLVGTDHAEVAKSLFIAFTVLYGLFASAYISLFSSALVELFGVGELPRVSGVMYMMQGAAAMAGIPLAGLLIKDHGVSKRPGDYMGMSVMVGACLLGATAAVGWVRVEASPRRARS
ncbi:hypothetical protein NEMBOFW57_006186 [Staphylotrichum longicolle]|uniref:Major facilitator superfamily (MFS) profile domain-containing protein n=1 Tax=Staphylotrichum longicolle TaxID=669026 RepID=A0AAD4EYX7_9PEZI|nr:hypothetical protein NEMBOFW57_006186 [Staphylotrichum longicolle]